MIPHEHFCYNSSMSKIRQIFLDQDGVLADYESGLTKALGYKVDLKAKKDVYDQEKRKLTAQRLFRNLEPLPDAWKLVDYCLNSGIHTEILTAAGTVNVCANGELIDGIYIFSFMPQTLTVLYIYHELYINFHYNKHYNYQIV